ncbi:MAG: patA 1 [Labilithrix sp.]|nr:patA 1 [Labilithrix sp.]
MLFIEPAFLFLFLPVLLGSYYVTPARFRNLLLTFASLFFYALGEWKFVPLMIASIGVNYGAALWIERTRASRWGAAILVLGIMSDLVLLLVFKYAGWMVENVDAVLSALHVRTFAVPHILLPLGISFFTFHKISYKIDVYRGDTRAQRNPLTLGLYILFFPQLIAGPIVRYHDIADQLRSRTVTASSFTGGVRRILVGVAKKVIIANSMATIADGVFTVPSDQLSTGLAWLGVVCFTLQIYFDFSGYSDMAIGLAALFGFEFLENFDHPYAARSVTEFWRRWHISLSRWFRDYVYIPLGGNRGGPTRTYVNLVTIFFLCGLWHGASWDFVVWGLFHGAFLVIERVGLGKLLTRLPRPLQHVYLVVTVMFGWVFFRAGSLGRSVEVIRSMLGLTHVAGARYTVEAFVRVPTTTYTLIAIGVILSFPVRPALERALVSLARDPQRAPVGRALAGSYTLVLFALFGVALAFVAADTYNPFLYFRF